MNIVERKFPLYFVLEGIVASGKSTTLGWIKKFFAQDSPKLIALKEPVEEFNTWSSYKPLIECYKNPEKNVTAAQLHILKKSFEYYGSQLLNVRKQKKCDFVLSERCVYSPLVFTEAYFKADIFSPLTRDYILSEWEQLMASYRSREESTLISPDFIIQICVDPAIAVKRILKGKLRSREERDFNSFSIYNFSNSLAEAYDSVYSGLHFPLEKVFVSEKSSEFEMAQQVCSPSPPAT